MIKWKLYIRILLLSVSVNLVHSRQKQILHLVVVRLRTFVYCEGEFDGFSDIHRFASLGIQLNFVECIVNSVVPHLFSHLHFRVRPK